MNINFKATTIKLTDEVRAYAQDKVKMVTKLLQNVDEENIRTEVELERKQNQQSGKIFRSDITIYVGGNKTHSVGHGESILAAIDEAKDRDKGKKQNMFRRGASRIKKMLRFWE